MNKKSIGYTIAIALLLAAVGFYAGVQFVTVRNNGIVQPVSSSKESHVQTDNLLNRELDEKAEVFANSKINEDEEDLAEIVDCGTVVYQQILNMCSAYKVLYLQERLEDEYKKTSAYLHENLDLSENALSEIKNNWQNIIDKTCHIAGLWNEGGSIQPLVENSCAIDILKQQIESIHCAGSNPDMETSLGQCLY